MTQNPNSIRARLLRALSGEPIDRPVYLTYDWFVQNRDLDWDRLFKLGLGQLNHVNVVETSRPNLEIVEKIEQKDGSQRKTVRWITDRGELQEVYVNGWQQEHFVKRPEDYRILQRAFEGVTYHPTSTFFDESEAKLGDHGFTIGTIGWTPIRRSPLLQIQVDFAGQERFAYDIIDRVPELLELIEQLNETTLAKLRAAVCGPAKYIKFWENLAIDMLGVHAYREWCMPFYRKMLEIANAADKVLLFHYDGKLNVIRDDIASMDIQLDSLTPPPEGDMSIADARFAWPDKFFWMHPPLGWFREDYQTLTKRIGQMFKDSGEHLSCLMLSEDIPPNAMDTIPIVLESLSNLRICRD